MPRFAANLTHLWTELPFLDRFDAAAEAGFPAVEVLFPYDLAVKDIQDALHRNALRMILINAPPPNYTGGTPGYAAIPGGAGRFDHDLRRALRYAEALGVSYLHVMSGNADGPEARDTMVANLRRAAATAPDGITLTLEPLNPGDMPSYFLNDYDLAAGIIADIGAPNVGLQFDSYHAQVITGDALGTFERHKDIIRHIQIGDAPGRTPPGTGQVDFRALFAAIDASGYDSWISAEYKPGKRTEDSLGWLRNTGTP